MTHRTCDVTDCERKHLARGLCKLHYRRAYPPKKDKPVECPTCGETTYRRDAAPRSDAATTGFCSTFCRDLWRVSQPNYSPPAGSKQRVCVLPDDHPVRAICPLDIRWCRSCGQEFACRPSRRIYCTQRCAWKAKANKRSRRHLSRRETVFERDNYTCWICDEPTSSRYTQGDIWSPTIDHLTPQSLGGGDELDNLATAHMWCNSVRGASLDISPAA